jgi:hypothetical protein
MTQVSAVDDFISEMEVRAPAGESTILHAERQLGLKLPGDYVSFLQKTNGGEGWARESEYLVLYSADELAIRNTTCSVQELAPGLLIFGSDGAGEAYGFDTRDKRMSVVMVPFIPMRWKEAIEMATTFTSFITRLRGGDLEDVRYGPNRPPDWLERE